MKIYLLLAHPDNDSFNARIAQAYRDKAIEKGHDVRLQRLGDMQFDPILKKDFIHSQPLEPDLQQAQQNILWCEKWVVVYPIWWGSFPALFKGFIDRTLLSGFAYQYHKNNSFWDKLLKGRSAEIITTSDAPNFWIWWQYRNSDLHTIKDAIFRFCGIKPIKSTRIDRVRYLDEAKRQRWIEKIIAKIK